jgi:RHS repeat-associated protein
LSPFGSWSAGGESGNFTYSYPITVPPAPGGGAPSVALAYDSGSVDGRTSATSSQASWIGDGWDYTPGFIERSYQPCSQDGITNSGDECWAGNQVSLSLGAHSALLVRDDTTGVWKSQNDDGTQVVPLKNVNNGAWQGEAWEVITPDGTQYYFGQNYLPTTTSTGASTQSAWTEPVYCPKSGDGPPGLTCYSSSTGTNSFVANMAWRWNLAYVVDPHGNLQTYTWTPESNFYDRGYAQGNGTGTNTTYTRGGYLSQITYGTRLSDAIAGKAALDTVAFGVTERCLTTSTFTNCASSNLSSTTADNWPDVPFDQICAKQTDTCSNYSPTFFTNKRLTSITTSVLVGGTPQTVDSWALAQMFPSPQAGIVTPAGGVSKTNPGDGTAAVMWLNSIQRTGSDTSAGGAAVTLPAITFTADEMPNRVDGTTTGSAALYRPRMDYYTTETGSQVVVSYATPDCSRVNNTMPASEDNDTMNCYPQYWVPISGTTPMLDWFNKYQVVSVTVNDMVAPTAWSEAQVTSYAYSGIGWHRDDSPLTPSAQRTWNQFRGYRTVTTTVGSASVQSVPTQTVTTYLQGMDGDHLKNGTTRSVAVTDSVGDAPVTDSNWLQGQTLESQSLLGVGGAVQKKSVSGPWTFTTAATESQANSMPALVSRRAATTEDRGYQLWHDGSWKKTETDVAYDSSGRVSTSDAKGDGTAAVPEVCTTTTYAQDTGRNMLAYPDEAKAVVGACGTAANAANTVSDNRTYYDQAATLGGITGPGDATKTEAVDSYTTGPNYVTESQSIDDAYGRVTSATDADNHTTTTAYSTPGTSPDTITVQNPMTWASTTTLDPARGLPTAKTDVNNELTSLTYDGLGRLTAAWSPLNAKAAGALADKTFAYSITGTAPTTVSTSTLRIGGGYYNTDVAIYDGELRPIQSQSINYGGVAGRLLTDTHYNSLGQTVKTTNPYNETSSTPTTAVYVPANDSVVPGETEPSYDGLGRQVRSLFVADGVNQWSTNTAYTGTDRTDVTPPAGGTATSTFVDAVGRTSAVWRYSTAAPTGNAGDAITTGYTYTAAGQTATVSDNAGNTWRLGYDLHQRKVSSSDPDTAANTFTTTAYSPGGEVLSTTDPLGSQISYTYDALGRQTAEYNTTGNVAQSASNQMAGWTYDTLAKGQTTTAVRYTNGAGDAAHTYTHTVQGYNAQYSPTGITITVPSAEGALAGSYQSTTQYDATTGVQTGQHYVAEGGLPKEQVNFAYSTGGLLNAFGGSFTYANSILYNPTGQVLQTNFGLYGKQLSRTENYDLPTSRLLSISDSLQTLSNTLDTSTLTYTASGSVTSQATSQNGVAVADTQCFAYDQLDRLTSAWTDTNGVTSSTTSPTAKVFGLGGCNDTAPVAGKVTGGPAPYWDSYGYDSLGDRVSSTSHDTSVTGHAADVTQTLSYNGYNAATGANTAAASPDAVQQVATTNSSGTTTSTYGYDNAGNTKTRSGQSFAYDPEGRTSSVTNTATNTTTTYTYAADGSLLLQRNPATNSAILYLPFGEEIHLSGTSTVSGLRYYSQSPDGVTIVRSSAGTVSYELTDTRKTAATSVDASTLAATVRYQDPYGGARGATPASWPDQHGYLGKPTDPTTGLDLLGARNYDSAIGRFLAIDPVFQPTNQSALGGYNYGGDNPIDNSDPTGKCWVCLSSIVKVVNTVASAAPVLNVIAEATAAVPGLNVVTAGMAAVGDAAVVASNVIGVVQGADDVYHDVKDGKGLLQTGMDVFNTVSSARGLKGGSKAIDDAEGGLPNAFDGKMSAAQEDQSVYEWQPRRAGVDAFPQGKLPADAGITNGKNLEDGEYAFVVKRDGSVRAMNYDSDAATKQYEPVFADDAAANPGQRFYPGHTSLADGEPVWMAGELTADGGKVTDVNVDSGHLKPSETDPDYLAGNYKPIRDVARDALDNAGFARDDNAVWHGTWHGGGRALAD